MEYINIHNFPKYNGKGFAHGYHTIPVVTVIFQYLHSFRIKTFLLIKIKVDLKTFLAEFNFRTRGFCMDIECYITYRDGMVWRGSYTYLDARIFSFL